MHLQAVIDEFTGVLMCRLWGVRTADGTADETGWYIHQNTPECTGILPEYTGIHRNEDRNAPEYTGMMTGIHQKGKYRNTPEYQPQYSGINTGILQYKYRNTP